mmetsp:Transcript_52814/g.113093  ORF Transcript_52814/g.113093 Transcript_52814/m.113093 type:complete len:540 (-) Transcript_52814:122-1741(-)
MLRSLVQGVRRNSSLDRLDSLSEITLGLCATLAATCLVFLLALPLFDIAGKEWINMWEWPNVNLGPPPVSLLQVRVRMTAAYSTTHNAFLAMDKDKDGYASLAEFTKAAQTFQAPLNATQAEYAFKGLDTSGDNYLTPEELDAVMDLNKFPVYYPPSTTTTRIVATTTTMMGTTTTLPATTANHIAASSSTAETTTTTAITTTTLTATSTTRTTTTKRTTTTDASDLGPLTFAQFKQRMGPAIRDSPRDAFAALDQNHDGSVSLDEFTSATKDFVPPLTISQAEDVFFRLDTNRDNKVEQLEYFTTNSAGKFRKPAREEQPITLEEYKTRLSNARPFLRVHVVVKNLHFMKMTEQQKANAAEHIVMDLAQAVQMDNAVVQDMDGNPGSVSLSGEGLPPPAGRRLEQVQRALHARARIDVPKGKSDAEMKQGLRSGDTLGALAEHLGQVPDILSAVEGDSIKAENVDVFVSERNSYAFATIDSDQDGVLSIKEFTQDTQSFEPPLTTEQSEFAFKGLDKDKDGWLSALEFEGFGLTHFAS